MFELIKFYLGSAAQPSAKLGEIHVLESGPIPRKRWPKQPTPFKRCASFVMRWASFWATGVGWVLFTHVAVAQTTPGRVSVRWSAPDECPDDVQLVHQIEKLLAEPLPDRAGDASPLEVRVNVQGSPSAGYAAKLSFESSQGKDQRDLEHPSCEKLVSAVALVVALAIDPERVHANQAAEHAEPLPETPVEANAPLVLTTPAPAPAAAPQIEPISRPNAPRPPSALRGARAAVHGFVGDGALPSFGAGLEGELGFHRGAFRADLVARFWLAQNKTIAGAVGPALDLDLATLGVRGCFLPLDGTWRLAACVGVDAGSEWASGVGFDLNQSTHARYSDAAARIEVGYVQSQLTAEGGLELTGALDRPRFGYDQGETREQTFRPSGWGFVAFFGLGFEL